MVKDKKVFVVGPQKGYANWLEDMGFTQTFSTENADLFMFTGGEDVNPTLYGEDRGHYTQFNNTRDNMEIPLHNLAYKKGKPCIGICRGGQLLTVLAGGKLVQDMSHPSMHNIKTYDGKTLQVTSSHHQQFLIDEKITGLVEGVDYELIGWAEKLSPNHLDGKNLDYGFPQDYKEPEIVYYKNTNTLAIQSHPEWQSMSSPTVKYLQNLVEQLLNKTICQNKEKELELLDGK